MKFLLDTTLLLWAASEPEKISKSGRLLLDSEENKLYFSAASFWEVVMRRSLEDIDANVDPALLKRGLIDNGYVEIPVTAEHALAVYRLPPIHNDPFERLLIAQSMVEGITLLTVDPLLAQYPCPVRKL